jgi:cephalosporin-C deacetylase-like acetyl esterase
METPAPLPDYPGPAEVDAWIDSVWALVDATDCPAERLDEPGFIHNLGIRHAHGFTYVRFSPARMPTFYGYWQPAAAQPAPLLLHVPGYNAEMSAHPDLVAAGFNVLHVSPLGYSTPSGADLTQQRGGIWPVLPDTILTHAEGGYRHWLANALLALQWAQDQPEVIPRRVSFFGTSQGGAGALLLASLCRESGVRCAAADVPFLTDFRRAGRRGAYAIAAEVLDQVDDPAAWRALGLIDTLSHVHRLDLPVLLTAGGRDEACPPDTIETLFARLPGTRSLTYLKDTVHGYTQPFIPLAAAWFRLYA